MKKVEGTIVEQTEDYIDEALKKYSITESEIAKLEVKYMALKVDGVNDTEGYDIVRTARIDVKSKRVDVEKKRKELKAESLKFGKAVDGKAKEITLLLEPIEEYLQTQEKIITDEKERIKNEAAEKEAKRIQDRMSNIFAIGMLFNGYVYAYQNVSISESEIKTMTDDEYHAIINDVAEVKRVEASAQAETDRLKKEEEDRLTKQKEEQEVESKRLKDEQDRITKEQDAKEAELQKEANRLAAEKRLIEQAKQDAIDKKKQREDEELLKKEMEAKAKKDAEDAEKARAMAKAEEERVAKMEAELAEKLRPDTEKLLSLADDINGLSMPELANQQSHDVLNKAQGHLDRAVQILRQVQ